ncbi:hypothetical protein MesoLj113a_18350 [Mesorhizobium sp. 113-1-2]|nr:hypothetical protein MesoLj113a_18350 [Mesorhizobium sp. 113-1-2]
MPNQAKEPRPAPDPNKTPVDDEVAPEPKHIDPSPRDVREAPVPNPKGADKS